MSKMFKKRFGFLSVFDLFPIVIILLNILDFFEVIPPSFDFLKKILSWTLLAGILLRESPSKVFFGHRHKLIDGALITSYFLMIIKNLTSYANVIVDERSMFQPLFIFVLEHHGLIEEISFIMGMLFLVVIAVIVTARIRFDKRSVMGVLHEAGDPSFDVKDVIIRFSLSFLVFVGFFLFVFNLMMEWLAIAVDSTILMAALLFYSIFSVHHHLGIHKFLSKVGDIGSSFYQKFIDHFRYKESLLLGITGLLVLHALTDISNFLIPYIIGIKDKLYFGLLGVGHDTIWKVIGSDLSSQPVGFGVIALLVVFLANVLGYLFLFASPGIIWFFIVHKNVPRLPKSVLVIFFTSLVPSLLSPLFRIKRLAGQNLIGVDVQTQSIFNHIDPFISFGVMIVALVIAVIFVEHRHTTRILENIWVIISTVLFGSYIWLYFLDISRYYQDVILGTISMGLWGLTASFIIFEVMTVAFYIGGFVLFCHEVWKHMGRKHNIK